MTRSINNYGKKENLFKDLTPTGDDFREGLTAVISMRVGHPQFEGQTKTKLGNSEVEGLVNTVVGEALAKYLEENPRNAKLIAKKGLLAAEAREAAKKAKDLLRKRKDALGGGGLPGKLRDCISSKMEECELYLVEGDSAGGSAEGGRFRDTQPSCRFAVRSSTPTRVAKTRCWPMKKCRASFKQLEVVSERIKTLESDDTTASLS